MKLVGQMQVLMLRATGFTFMSSIRELGYLNQTSLLRKNFKIRGLIVNAGQIIWLSFVSL